MCQAPLKGDRHRKESNQLENHQFVSKAPAHVVEGIRKRVAELEVLIQKIRTALENLS